MREFQFKQFTRRHRPHFQAPGATLFVTYRLAGSIPKSIIREHDWRRAMLEKQLKLARSKLEDSLFNNRARERIEQFQRQWFAKFEAILHQNAFGPTWLKDKRIASLVSKGLHELDGDEYRLDCYCIMSNHVHTVFQLFVAESNLREVLNLRRRPEFLSSYPGLSDIMKTLKGRSARKANILLGRGGSFWEHESFDHVVRVGRFKKTVSYVLNNPVKAGIVKEWRHWPWSYCRKEVSDKL